MGYIEEVVERHFYAVISQPQKWLKHLASHIGSSATSRPRLQVAWNSKNFLVCLQQVDYSRTTLKETSLRQPFQLEEAIAKEQRNVIFQPGD